MLQNCSSITSSLSTDGSILLVILNACHSWTLILPPTRSRMFSSYETKLEFEPKLCNSPSDHNSSWASGSSESPTGSSFWEEASSEDVLEEEGCSPLLSVSFFTGLSIFGFGLGILLTLETYKNVLSKFMSRFLLQ